MYRIFIQFTDINLNADKFMSDLYHRHGIYEYGDRLITEIMNDITVI